MTEPSPGYHGVKFFETFGDFAFTMRAAWRCLRVYGAALSPDQRLADPARRRDAAAAHGAPLHQRAAVAQFLQSRPARGWVNYPGLPDHPQHALMLRQMRRCAWPAGGAGLLVRREGRAWRRV
jgi:O-acetylhomoserine (thiol)-lyase